jgi:hypothetical protein
MRAFIANPDTDPYIGAKRANIMKKFLLSLPFFFLLVPEALSQTDTSAGFRINPPGLNVAPLKANIEEPRIGVFKFLDAAQMKVDIGNSIDVAGYSDPGSALKVTAGIDFMAYAFTTGAQGLRLQIDAIDGFFGGNVSLSKAVGTQTLQLRLRILHHSAHFVDGHYDETTGTWIDNRAPVPYTRDFGELAGAYLVEKDDLTLRPYAGIGYATLIRPAEFNRFSCLAGVELAFGTGTIAGEKLNIYGAYNVSLEGTPEFIASQQIQAGAKLGDFYGKGPSLYLAYYTGNHMFGEYYGERLTTTGLGFTVDF